jgi:peptidoglycan hydrolase CwlO-like protein
MRRPVVAEAADELDRMEGTIIKLERERDTAREEVAALQRQCRRWVEHELATRSTENT